MLHEIDTPKGMAHYHRYHEVLDEVALAEDMGFDFWGTSEQHFLPSWAPSPAPETLYGAVAARTNRIKLRHMSILMLAFNHPIRVAERLAVLDLLSRGRVELSTARSNSASTLDPFGVNASETRDQWRETLEVVVKALTDPVVEHEGKYWNIKYEESEGVAPPRVVPRLYRRELFPISVICSSVETHRMAGELGLGSITNDGYVGWDHVEKCVALYKESIKNAQPFGNYPVNDSIGYATFTANCAATREKAIESSKHVIDGFFRGTIWLYEELAARTPDYNDFGLTAKLKEMIGDYEAIMNHSPTVMVGTPDDLIEKIKRLEAMGIDEVILRIDGFGHSVNKESIEMVGKYVIPEFQNSMAIVGSDVTPHNYEELGVEMPRFLT
ncbi:MAG: LLM class flavin-dependent oxidoreductase [Actinobacteria bacterium]|nr:LLM class flavin-dependent oxidoreductase [Actinomycetota bacterium]